MSTRVINVRSGKHYDTFGGRPGWLGNPYVVGEWVSVDGRHMLVRTRDQAIELYGKLFAIRIEQAAFRLKILALEGQTLACYCRPKRCHLDVIVNWLKKNSASYCHSCGGKLGRGGPCTGDCDCVPFN